MRSAGRWPRRHRHRRPTYPKEQPKWRCRLTGFPNLLFIPSLTAYDQSTTMRKVSFWWRNHQTRPPRRHLTFLASRPNMMRLLWQCMVLLRRQGTYMYMYLNSRTQISRISMVIHNIATGLPVLEGNSQNVV